jgi:hypothetical protein
LTSENPITPAPPVMTHTLPFRSSNEIFFMLNVLAICNLK